MDHKFVEFIPSEIEENVLYISLEYNITKHLCPCGCGSEIAATLSPARYQLSYDGETVSLHPSFGNWLHDCKSHYCIIKDEVVWANPMSKNRMEAVIKKDKKEINEYITKKKSKELIKPLPKKKSLFERFKNKLNALMINISK